MVMKFVLLIAVVCSIAAAPAKQKANPAAAAALPVIKEGSSPNDITKALARPAKQKSEEVSKGKKIKEYEWPIQKPDQCMLTAIFSDGRCCMYWWQLSGPAQDKVIPKVNKKIALNLECSIDDANKTVGTDGLIASESWNDKPEWNELKLVWFDPDGRVEARFEGGKLKKIERH